MAVMPSLDASRGTKVGTEALVLLASVEIQIRARILDGHIQNVPLVSAYNGFGARTGIGTPQLVEDRCVEEHGMAVLVATRRTDNRRARLPPGAQERGDGLRRS